MVIDEPPAHFDELLKGAHLRALRIERLEALGVLEQELERELVIGRIVLGAATPREFLKEMGQIK